MMEEIRVASVGGSSLKMTTERVVHRSELLSTEEGGGPPAGQNDESEAPQVREMYDELFGLVRGPQRLKGVTAAKALCEMLARYDISNVNFCHAPAGCQEATLLHWSVYNDDILLMRELLRLGARTDFCNSHQQSPLQWAVARCSVRAVHELAEQGADVEHRDTQGLDGVMYAAQHGHAILLHYFALRGHGLDRTDLGGHTLLHWACYNGHADCVRLLLRRGLSAQTGDDDGMTPLHRACARGHTRVAMILIEHDPYALTCKDRNGDTPASLAVKRGHRFSAGHYDLIRAMPGLFKVVTWMVHEDSMYKSVIWFVVPFLILAFSRIVLAWAHWSIFLYIIYTCIQVAGSLGYLAMSLSAMGRSSAVHGSHICLGYMSVGIVLESYRNGTAPLDDGLVYYWGVFTLSVYVVLAVLYAAVAFGDPGYAPQKAGLSTLADFQQLLGSGAFDGLSAGDNGSFDQFMFCTVCEIRKPLRANHCYACNRCVVKHEYHCPFVNNCVGVRTSPIFVLWLCSFAVMHMLLDVFFIMRFFSMLLAEPFLDVVIHVIQQDREALILFIYYAVMAPALMYLLIIVLMTVSSHSTMSEYMVANSGAPPPTDYHYVRRKRPIACLPVYRARTPLNLETVSALRAIFKFGFESWSSIYAISEYEDMMGFRTVGDGTI